jgi:hypothetical protein
MLPLCGPLTVVIKFITNAFSEFVVPFSVFALSRYEFLLRNAYEEKVDPKLTFDLAVRIPLQNLDTAVSFAAHSTSFPFCTAQCSVYLALTAPFCRKYSSSGTVWRRKIVFENPALTRFNLQKNSFWFI